MFCCVALVSPMMHHLLFALFRSQLHFHFFPFFLLTWDCCSVDQLCPTLCNPMDCSTPGLPVHHHLPQSLLKLMSIESMMPSNYLIFCRPFLLLPSILSSIRDFSNKSALHIRWPNYWSFSFSISPSNEFISQTE